MRGNPVLPRGLGLSTSTAGDMGSIPGLGTKIPHASRCGQKPKNQKQGKNQKRNRKTEDHYQLFRIIPFAQTSSLLKKKKKKGERERGGEKAGWSRGSSGGEDGGAQGRRRAANRGLEGCAVGAWL